MKQTTQTFFEGKGPTLKKITSRAVFGELTEISLNFQTERPSSKRMYGSFRNINFEKNYDVLTSKS